jgi:hypothetical protein
MQLDCILKWNNNNITYKTYNGIDDYTLPLLVVEKRERSSLMELAMNSEIK